MVLGVFPQSHSLETRVQGVGYKIRGMKYFSARLLFLQLAPLALYPLHIHSPVQMNYLTGDIGGTSGYQELHHPGNILRLTCTAQRNLG